MTNPENLLKKLEKFKYPLCVLLIGLFLLLNPFGASGKTQVPEPDEKMTELLSQAEGIGHALVLSTDHGVIVVCEGADNPRVCLDIIRAIGSYTGFGSDKITVLKMAEKR